MSILNRYLIRETATSFVAVVLILLAIIVGGIFVRLLSRVADGLVSVDLLLPMLGLSTISSLSVLMSVALFLAIMVTLGRLYVDSEVTAMQAAGLSVLRLVKPFLWFGLLIAILQSLLTLWIEPWATGRYQVLRQQAASSVDLGGITPGRFVSLAGSGNRIVYAEQLDSQQRVLKRIFLFDESGDAAQVIAAAEARQVLDAESGRKYLQLAQGEWLVERPASRTTRITEFGLMGLFLPGMGELEARLRPSSMPTKLLVESGERHLLAELHWRISSPLMALVLVLLAVPLSYTSPRKGRFGSLGVAVLSCILYFNLLGVAKGWMASGTTPIWLGLWWVHLLPLSLAAFLLWRQRAFSGLRGAGG